MQRRIEAGISDSVEDLNGGVNGGAAPAFNQELVGKRLEVLWPYNAQGHRCAPSHLGQRPRRARRRWPNRQALAESADGAARRHDTPGVGCRPRV